MNKIVLEGLNNLTDVQKGHFYTEYNRRKKNLFVAYMCWLVFLHYLYLNKASVWLRFILTLAGLFIWWLVDLFRMPFIVSNVNNDIAIEVLKDVKQLV